MQPTSTWSLKDSNLIETHVTLSKITMSDLSSPTGQKNLCKTYSTFWGGGASGMSQPPVLCIPGFRLFFLTSSVLSALFRLSLGGEGDSGMSNLPYFAFPACASFSWLLQSISLRQTYFGSSLLFAGREATTGNTSALRKLSQATVPLALFRLRNI